MAKKVETKTVRGMGDNAPDQPISGERLGGFITKIEKLNAKKEQVLQELRETYADAKAVGYDNKTIRRIVREKKIEPEKRKEQQELYDLYRSALGILDED